MTERVHLEVVGNLQVTGEMMLDYNCDITCHTCQSLPKKKTNDIEDYGIVRRVRVYQGVKGQESDAIKVTPCHDCKSFTITQVNAGKE